VSVAESGNIWLVLIVVANLAVLGVFIYIASLVVRALRKYLRS